MSNFGPDVWMPPIRITPTTNQFRIAESGGSCTFSIVPGVYYLHNDPALDGNAPGLYRALADVLNNDTLSAWYESHTGVLPVGGNYNFFTHDPTVPPFVPNSGLRIGDVGIDFAIEFTHVDFTMDPNWFGFPAGDGNASIDGPAYYADSPASVLGRWYSWNLFGGAAARKHPIPFADVEYSSRRPSDSRAIPWEQGRYRSFSYAFVQSPHLFDRRGNLQTYANNAGIGFGDINNAFESNIYRPLTESERCIVVHDSGQPDLVPSLHPYEMVKLATPWPEFLPTRAPYEGEFYNLDFRVWVDLDVGGYDF